MRKLWGMGLLGVALVGCSGEGTGNEPSGAGGASGSDAGGSGGGGGGRPSGAGGGSDSGESSLDCTDDEEWCGGACLAPGESAGGCTYVHQSGFTLLWPLAHEDGKVFFAAPELSSMNLDGTAVTQLAELQPLDIVVGPDALFVLEGETLYSVPKEGGTPTLLAEPVSATNLTLVGERLYFLRSEVEHVIASVDLAGGDEIIHTPDIVYDRFIVSDSHLYFTSVEMVDGDEVEGISRVAIGGQDVEMVVEGAWGVAMVWSNEQLYFVDERGVEGLKAWDPATGEVTLLLADGFGAYPHTGFIHNGHYVGMGGSSLTINLETLEPTFLDNDFVSDWPQMFIEGGRVYYHTQQALMALELP